MLEMKPLHHAVRDGDARRVQEELVQGSEVEVRDRLGRTPLRMAVEDANAEICEALLRAGASLTQKDEQGRSPLSIATPAFRNELASLLALLERERLASTTPTARKGTNQRL